MVGASGVAVIVAVIALVLGSPPASTSGMEPMATATTKSKNLFCELSALHNEASVEQFFVSRLIESLGYTDTQIKPTNSLEKLKVSVGRKKFSYVPDYAIVINRKVRWICDAKAPTEKLDVWEGRGRSYALELNKKCTGENPWSSSCCRTGSRRGCIAGTWRRRS